jgi:hypothetical protein
MHCSKFTEHAVECNIGAFSIVWVDAAKIGAGGEDFLTVLNFINKHIIPSTVFFDFVFDVREKFNRVLQRLETGILQIDFNYVVFFNPVFYEMLPKKVEKKVALSASSYPGYDFYEVVVFCVYYTFEQEVSFDSHDDFSIYKLLDSSNNLKA